MSKVHQFFDLLPWEPTPTELPEVWMTLSNQLAEQAKGSLRAYILDIVKYDAQKVGALLRSWGLPWQVVVAGYLWEYEENEIIQAQLDDVEQVINHINNANTYVSYIEDGALTLLLTPPYRDLGALLIAVAIYYEALHTLQQQSSEQPYRGKKLQLVENVGRTLLNIAKNFGMWNFKRNIEDITEQLHSPRKFTENQLEHQRILEQDHLRLEEIRQLLLTSYQEATRLPIQVIYIPCGITGLERRIQDAHTTATSQKTQLTGFDLVTFEIIVPTVQECYEALGIMSQLGRIQDRVTDLIASPKPNGCSHLALGLEVDAHQLKGHATTSLVCQLQISTSLMHAIAKFGCLHPSYYHIYTEGIEEDSKVALPYIWHSEEGSIFHVVRTKLVNQHNQTDAKKPIVVYDKNRNSITLPLEATALDFAYQLDVELGERAVEAIVNNRKAPLYRKLDAGDIVEIRTSNDIQTQYYWIDENYATTAVARSQIKASLNRRLLDLKGYILIRQELELHHYMLTPGEFEHELRTLLKKHQLGTFQAYLKKMGKTDAPRFTPKWAAQEIVHQIEERKESLLSGTGDSRWVPKLITKLSTNQKISHQHLCNFCKPVYPRDTNIQGLFKRNGELVVHKQTCPFLIGRGDGQKSRVLPMSWHLQPPPSNIGFFLVAHDRPGLLFQISKQLHFHHCNLLSIGAEAITKSKEVHVRFVGEVHEDEHVLTILQALDRIDGVLKAEMDAYSTARATYERIQKLRNQVRVASDARSVKPEGVDSVDMLSPRKAELNNPYDISRPATGKMFFGRSFETHIMRQELCEGNVGKALILYGPRRSGKSSICKNFLEYHVHPPLWGVLFSLQNAEQQSEEIILKQLADKVCQEFHEQLQQPSPNWQLFNEPDPQMHFRHVLQACFVQMPNTRLVLALDEFGGALDAFEKHFLHERFFNYWKDLMNDFRQLSLIFILPTSSHRTLTRNFPNAFSFMEPIRVSFLDRESAVRLLVDPLKDQDIKIHPQTVEKAFMLTMGNPYYMTLIGQQIFHQLNAYIHKQHVNEEDLQRVIEYLIEGNFNQNFDFLQRELANKNELQVLEAIVNVTVRSNSKQAQLKKIAHELNWSTSITKRHLDRLHNGLILRREGVPSNPYYSFTIELMRLWLENNYWFFTPQDETLGGVVC